MKFKLFDEQYRLLEAITRRRNDAVDAVFASLEAFAFQPVEKKVPNKYYVVIGAGEPTVRHTTKKIAVEQAQRLAAKHPGQTFTVCESVCEATIVVTSKLVEATHGCPLSSSAFEAHSNALFGVPYHNPLFTNNVGRGY